MYSELHQRKVLDKLLARALQLPLKNDSLSIIDDCNYVLTLDYTIKMLDIHERYSCGVPVIIKGETGVGKTALVEMLSELWNFGLINIWNRGREKVLDAMKALIEAKVDDSSENYHTCLKIVQAIAAGDDVSIKDLIVLGELNSKNPSEGKFHNSLRKMLMDMEKDPAIGLLTVPVTENGQNMNRFFLEAEGDSSTEVHYNSRCLPVNSGVLYVQSALLDFLGLRKSIKISRS